MVNLQLSCPSLPGSVILTVTSQLINFLAVLKRRGTDTLNANDRGGESALCGKKNVCKCLCLCRAFLSSYREMDLEQLGESQAGFGGLV